MRAVAKGRAERSIRYIREAFFAAREFSDLDDLNAQACVWCEGQASDRPWPEDSRLSVREAFEPERAKHAQVACRLNAMGMRSGSGKAFTRRIVLKIRLHYSLKSRYDRLRERGMLTLEEMAQRLTVAPCTLKTWQRAGLLPAHRFGGREEYLYEPPGAQPQSTHQRINASTAGKDYAPHSGRQRQVPTDLTDEVQCSPLLRCRARERRSQHHEAQRANRIVEML